MQAPRTRGRFVQIAAAASTASLWPAIARAQTPTVLRVSIPTVAANAQNLMMQRLAGMVEQRSGGRLKFEIYPNGQLAKQQASIDGLQTGVVDFTLQTSAFLEPLFPRVQAIDLPFLFKTRAAAERMLDGPIGQQLFEEMKTRGIQGLIWGTDGWREIENSQRPINTPADMRGMRMRIQNGPVYVSMMRALGATPVVVDFAETYTAVSQRTVDGLEIPLATTAENKFYEVCKYLTLSNHIYNAAPLLMSKVKYDALAPDLQRIIVQSAKEVQPHWRAMRVEKDAEGLKELRDKGMVVNQIDYPAFRKAMDPVYAEFRDKIGGDFLDRILKASG